MRLVEQPIEIVQRPEQRIHCTVVRDVVAEIGHRRLEERRDPDRIHAQPGDVVEFGDDAGQIAHPIAIGIQKTTRINLIDDGPAPPWCLRHVRPSRANVGTEMSTQPRALA